MSSVLNCTNFKVSQDDTFVYIKIFDLKYPKSENIETHVDGSLFHFFMEPYQLKLKVPGELNSEGELNTFVYNKEKATVTCRIEKTSKGEFFDKLDGDLLEKDEFD